MEVNYTAGIIAFAFTFSILLIIRSIIKPYVDSSKKRHQQNERVLTHHFEHLATKMDDVNHSLNKYQRAIDQCRDDTLQTDIKEANNVIAELNYLVKAQTRYLKDRNVTITNLTEENNQLRKQSNGD